MQVSNATRDSGIIPDILGPTMICTHQALLNASSGTPLKQVSKQSLLLCAWEDVEMAESPTRILDSTSSREFGSTFEKHIASVSIRNPAFQIILKKESRLSRSVSSFIIRPPRCSENTTFLNRTWQGRRFWRRGQIVMWPKKKQLEDLNYCDGDRKSLPEMAAVTKADKYDRKNKDHHEEDEKSTSAFQSQLPVLSDNERDRKKNYGWYINRHLGNAIKWVTMKKRLSTMKDAGKVLRILKTVPLSTYQWKMHSVIRGRWWHKRNGETN